MRIDLIPRIARCHVGDDEKFPEGSTILVTYIECLDLLMKSLGGEAAGNQVRNRSCRVRCVDILGPPVGRVELAERVPATSLEQAVEVRDNGWPIKVNIKCGLSFADGEFSERLGARVFAHGGLGVVLICDCAVRIKELSGLVNIPSAGRAVNYYRAGVAKIAHTRRLRGGNECASRINVNEIHLCYVRQLCREMDHCIASGDQSGKIQAFKKIHLPPVDVWSRARASAVLPSDSETELLQRG